MERERDESFTKVYEKRIKQLRMGHLFEEPCPMYEPEWDDDLWDCRLTYDQDDDE